MTARIFQINRSPGGVPKHAVHEVQIGELGLEGDGHDHPKIHGGPERAVCLFSLEVILALQAQGHPIFPGATGENVTITGLAWNELAASTRLQLGADVLLEITRATEPCKTIGPSFSDRHFRRIDERFHPGESRFYARVLREGRIRVGDAVQIVRS